MKILFTTIFVFALLEPAFAGLESDIFHVDPKSGHVSVSLSGENWVAQNATEKHIPLYQKLYANQEAMKHYGNGKVRAPEKVASTLNDMWLPRFKEGHPHGSLTVFNSQSPSKEPPFMGFVVAGGGCGPGVSEIAYAYLPDYWDRDLGPLSFDQL